MKHQLPFAKTPPEELARVRVSRTLVNRAEKHHLREALDVHARSIYGREIWKLNLAELEEIEATLGALIDFLDDQIFAARDRLH